MCDGGQGWRQPGRVTSEVLEGVGWGWGRFQSLLQQLGGPHHGVRWLQQVHPQTLCKAVAPGLKVSGDSSQTGGGGD